MRKLSILLFLPVFACSSNPDAVKAPEKEIVIDTIIIEKQDIVEEKINNSEFIVEGAQPFEFKNPDIPMEDTLVLNTENDYYEITPTGLLTINGTETVQLEIEPEMFIDRAFLYMDLEFLYIFFTETDNDVATSRLQKIDRNERTIKYTSIINGFNLGQPMLSENKAYVTAIGFVGKIDLGTGQYDWKKEDLYDHEKHSFNSFDTILIWSKDIEFISTHTTRKTTDKIFIGKNTGEIIEIIK